MGVISKHYGYVDFTAACDSCGEDAGWKAFVVVGGMDDPGTHTVYHIDCPCRPCLCGHHNQIGLTA